MMNLKEKKYTLIQFYFWVDISFQHSIYTYIFTSISAPSISQNVQLNCSVYHTNSLNGVQKNLKMEPMVTEHLRNRLDGTDLLPGPI